MPELHEFTCECGRKLQVALKERRQDPVFVVFCDQCYLNHRFEWKEGKPVLAQRYYFPDD